MPLLVMDCCLEEMEMQQAEQLIAEIQQQAKKHRGDFVFLQHNANDAWMHDNHRVTNYEKVLYEV